MKAASHTKIDKTSEIQMFCFLNVFLPPLFSAGRGEIHTNVCAFDMFKRH
jgi:hypothetical protein